MRRRGPPVLLRLCDQIGADRIQFDVVDHRPDRIVSPVRHSFLRAREEGYWLDRLGVTSGKRVAGQTEKGPGGKQLPCLWTG
jgi:hypothetical protein